jgi:hypothetical protein
MTGTKPDSPCQRHHSPFEQFLRDNADTSLGRGFLKCNLPENSIAVLQDLAIVDATLHQHRVEQPSHAVMCEVVNMRDNVHYRLLSLDSWDELDETTNAGTSGAVHDCTLLAAQIYSNAVIYPLPTESEWHLGLLDRLHNLIADTHTTWPVNIPCLHTWILVIANMAALGTRFEESFQQLWNQHVTRYPCLMSERTVLEAIRGFLWNEHACGRGFASMWASLKHKETEMSPAIQPADVT